MTEEFKKMYDACEAYEKAKRLAYGLGYLRGYWGNLDYDIDRCEREYLSLIDNIVGKEWPEDIKKLEREGYHEGYMDS